MYKNYVFDLYGTLADIRTDEWHMPVFIKAAEYYTKHGAEYEPEEFKELYDKFIEEEKADVHKRHPDFECVDIHLDKVFKKLFEIKGVSPTDEFVAETCVFFRRASREYIRLYDGIEELLTELHKKENVYLLSNAQRSFTWDELETLGIIDKFDGILISSDEECLKPDIHFYKALIDRYDLDPKETIMVGNDPVSDIEGGKRAGFDTLYIHTNISPALRTDTGCTYFIPDGDTLKMKDYLL